VWYIWDQDYYYIELTVCITSVAISNGGRYQTAFDGFLC